MPGKRLSPGGPTVLVEPWEVPPDPGQRLRIVLTSPTRTQEDSGVPKFSKQEHDYEDSPEEVRRASEALESLTTAGKVEVIMEGTSEEERLDITKAIAERDGYADPDGGGDAEETSLSSGDAAPADDAQDPGDEAGGDDEDA